MVSMFKREIKVRGAMIEYSGSDNGVERINCTDRIGEELIVQVRSRARPNSRPNFALCCRGPSTKRCLVFFNVALLHTRFCLWATCTIPMCDIRSTFPLKTRLSAFIGTSLALGKIATGFVKVRTLPVMVEQHLLTPGIRRLRSRSPLPVTSPKSQRQDLSAQAIAVGYHCLSFF